MTSSLNTKLDARHLLRHPFYEAWSAGHLSLDALRTYACQYFHHVDAFPRYISATHSNCAWMSARQILLENLREEEEGPGNHPALWLQFTRGLGLADAAVRSTPLLPATRQLIDTFLETARTSYAGGIGALYAYERQVPVTAASKIAGLEQHYGIEDKHTLRFFTVHLAADVRHANATQQLMQALDEGDKQVAEAAAQRIAAVLWDFLSAVQHETMGAMMH